MATISHKSSAPHYTWGTNCDNWTLLDTPGLSVKQESMPPAAKEVLHLHNKAQQFFFILKGTATFYCGDEKDTIGANTGISIPAGTKHYIANESNHELEFLVISQPSNNTDRVQI